MILFSLFKSEYFSVVKNLEYDAVVLIRYRFLFQFFDDTFSPAIEAAIRLQPRCSEKVERDSGLLAFTTRLLVPTSRIGCLIGKGGTIISEMRKVTKANIRILSKDNLPNVASQDDEMVQVKKPLKLVNMCAVYPIY